MRRGSKPPWDIASRAMERTSSASIALRRRTVYMHVMPNEELRECGNCYCFGLRRAARIVTQHYDRHLRPAGLRATQFTILATLAQTGPMPLSRLARRLGLERTTLTRNLRPLEAKGWLTVNVEEDRRVHMV